MRQRSFYISGDFDRYLFVPSYIPRASFGHTVHEVMLMNKLTEHYEENVSALRRIYVNHIAMHAKASSVKINIVPVILHLNQRMDNRISVFCHSRAK